MSANRNSNTAPNTKWRQIQYRQVAGLHVYIHYIKFLHIFPECTIALCTKTVDKMRQQVLPLKTM